MKTEDGRLHGVDAEEVLRQCVHCDNLEECCDNNWVVTTDGDGKTCDNYKPVKQEGRQR